MELDVHQKYAALTEALEDCAICTLDLQGNVTSWGKDAEALKGYHAEDVLGKNVSIFYSPEDVRNGLPVRAIRTATNLGRYEEEGWRLHKNGSRVWVHSVFVALKNPNGEVEGFFKIIRDLTERKRAEERFRLAVESAPNAMVMVNQDGRIVLVNSQTERLFGYTRKELLGAHVEILVPQAFRGKHPEARKKFFSNPEARSMGAGRDLFGLRKDGTQFPVEIGLNPIETDEGTLVLSAIVDITERKRADESRKKLEAQVQHAQKLESLGVLAGGIAHDFNNLLVSILGHSGLALMELAPEAPARRTVQMIETAAIRAAELTKQLLAYSGKGKFVIQPINLSRLVHEMSHLLSVSISKKISFLTSLPDDLPHVEADAVQMQQVVMNLITNASESIGDKNGSISVRTGITHINQEYLWPTFFEEDLPEGEYVFLEVTDTGSGIDPETKQRIFDPFFTTKFTGRGLGLAAVLGIVRGHHGAINLFSEVGQGTTFKVLLPVSKKKATPEITRTSDQSKSWRGTGTVLVIDDEEGVRIVVRTALERCGLRVLAAEDGRAGLQVFRKHAAEITLVLLDMTMPHMSGEEVFRELRRINPDLKIIISSGYNEQDTASLFLGKGLAGFIQKPYQPLFLIDKVRQTLEGSGHKDQGGAALGAV